MWLTAISNQSPLTELQIYIDTKHVNLLMFELLRWYHQLNSNTVNYHLFEICLQSACLIVESHGETCIMREYISIEYLPRLQRPTTTLSR